MIPTMHSKAQVFRRLSARTRGGAWTYILGNLEAAFLEPMAVHRTEENVGRVGVLASRQRH
jgi:hypothetical protein